MVAKVLIIGGTGAQGIPIIKELARDGKFHVRALTRDTESDRAKYLQSLGAELVKGELVNTEDLKRAFKDIDYCFVNTDTFTLGEKLELYHAIRIFEIASQTPTVKHFIFSNLPYLLKTHGEKYNAIHYSTKGRISEFIRAQPGGDASYSGMKYSFFTTCPYIDMLGDFLLPKKEGDTFVFEYPLGNGHLPFIALEDVGKYVRYMFDHLDQFIGKTLDASSFTLTLKEISETFTKATGLPSIYRHIESDKFFANIPDNHPAAPMDPEGLTFKQSFGNWWAIYRDAMKDYKYLDTINPERLSFEKWIRNNNYRGEPKAVLKGYNERRSKSN